MANSAEPFVTCLDSDEGWEHDEETGGLVRMLRADDRVQLGLWKPGPVVGTTIEVQLEEHETFLVLDGHGELVVDEGEPIALRPGVIVSIPRGCRTRWLIADEHFREIWLYS
jgi:uncharacterized cupin superfamily protein